MKRFNLHFDEEAREKITLIVISVVLTIIAIFLKGSQPLISTIIFLIAYLVSAQRVLRKAWKNIKSGDFFSENILMSIATIGALLIGEYPEAIAVMVLYEIGDIIEDMAVDRSKRSISNLLEAKPEFAHLKVNNDWQTVDPSVVKIDDIFMVKPGEKSH